MHNNVANKKRQREYIYNALTCEILVSSKLREPERSLTMPPASKKPGENVVILIF